MPDHFLGRLQPVNLVRRGKALFSGRCESHLTTVVPLAAAKAGREATTRLQGPVAASDQRAQCFSRTGYMRKMRICAVSHVNSHRCSKIWHCRCLGFDGWRHLNGPVCDVRPILQAIEHR